jgi:hypothetical protein
LDLLGSELGIDVKTFVRGGEVLIIIFFCWGWWLGCFVLGYLSVFVEIGYYCC